MKKIAMLAALAASVLLASCTNDADVASRNLSQEADSFRINRRIVFYNGITDTYLLEIRGLCSLGNYDPSGQVTVTCKTTAGQFKKHFLGLSDNVTFFTEQIDGADVNTAQYQVIFKPSAIVPDIEIR